MEWARKCLAQIMCALYEAGLIPEPGDWVYVWRFHQDGLEPRWKGPYIILLNTPTAIKVDGITTWMHYTHARPANPFSTK